VTVDIDINGRTRHVDVEVEGTGYVVTVDGRRHAADVSVIDGLWSLLVEGRGHTVAVIEQPPESGQLTIHVNGRIVTATVDRPVPLPPEIVPAAIVASAAPPAASEPPRPSVPAPRPIAGRSGRETSEKGPSRVIAPMPGKVVRVLVKPGDQVTARQGVVVVEAMKMENELQAPKAGTVAEVNVAEGSLVEAGALLVVIE
jgi:biotin carboxyl carrier protein